MILAAADYNWAFDLEIWAEVVFGIIVVVLVVFASTPIAESMRKRRERILEALILSENAEKELADARAEADRQRIRFRELAQGVIAEAKADATRVRGEILERAAAEADRAKRRSEREIELATQKALSEVWTAAAQLSTKVAEKFLATRLDRSDHERLLDEATADIGRYVGGRA